MINRFYIENHKKISNKNYVLWKLGFHIPDRISLVFIEVYGIRESYLWISLFGWIIYLPKFLIGKRVV